MVNKEAIEKRNLYIKQKERPVSIAIYIIFNGLQKSKKSNYYKKVESKIISLLYLSMEIHFHLF